MSVSAQDFLLYWVRQRAVVAALRSAVSDSTYFQTLLCLVRERDISIILIMTGACIIQVLRWMQVWVLLASDILVHATAFSQLEHPYDNRHHALTCPVPTLPDLLFPMCRLYNDTISSSDYVWTVTAEIPAAVTTTATVTTTAQSSSSSSSSSATQHTNIVDEVDADSTLDTAVFLSFEDWKKQNLAKIGQSADNVGGKRMGNDVSQDRQRQARAMNNALDSLGDDAEIELNFEGFGSDSAQPTPWESGRQSDQVNTEGDADDAHHNSADGVSSVGRRRDAGTTCKERFNYASFDCAATVLKTNPECSGSSSVLIENKDSYMLNECRAKNKFLILELCDDILVDTVVLANYEFFSSIFHTFRVSVSDRYPVKADKWKELGTFEAKNSRAIQAFAVENPLIWARYVKIEFLTHYGNEFYCPLSLVRIHGTTMLEEYKNEGDSSRSEEEIVETAEPVENLAHAEEPVPVPSQEKSDNSTVSVESPATEFLENTSPVKGSELEAAAVEFMILENATCPANLFIDQTYNTTDNVGARKSATVSSMGANVTDTIPSDSRISPEAAMISDTKTGTSSSDAQNVTARDTGSDATTPKTINVSGENSTTTTAEATKVTTSSPPSPNPTTQESFFKSVNKRLQMLESNSTLSLLYIEEQSRLLRDAFNKVEKRQMAKMNSFLEDLNTTVIDEIRNLHLVYQSLRSIVLDDYEHQQREVSLVASQLAILTNELVFQKRMTALSSVLIMILFALILFPRGSSIVGGIDFHSMIAWSPRPTSSSKMSRSPSTGPSSPSLDSETQSPPTVLRLKRNSRSLPFRNNLNEGAANLPAPAPQNEYNFSEYDDNSQFRPLSELSDSHIGHDPLPLSPDGQELLAYNGVSPKQINMTEATPVLSDTASLSPDIPQNRPMSSPPTLHWADTGRRLAENNDTAEGDDESRIEARNREGDISIEPFPPFPTD